MKLVFLMYLDEDDSAVADLLERHDVTAYSRLAMEGHGDGQRGWYGEVAPYNSQLVFALLPEEKAEELLEAVRRCADCKDPRHPIHAGVVDVEKAVDSGVPTPVADA